MTIEYQWLISLLNTLNATGNQVSLYKVSTGQKFCRSVSLVREPLKIGNFSQEHVKRIFYQ